jgi:hypothetical protein
MLFGWNSVSFACMMKIVYVVPAHVVWLELRLIRLYDDNLHVLFLLMLFGWNSVSFACVMTVSIRLDCLQPKLGAISQANAVLATTALFQ